MSTSKWLQDKVLNKIFKGEDFAIGQMYASIHTADPEKTGRREASYAEYSRQPIKFSEARGGEVSSSSVIDFRNMPAGVPITHVGIWTAETNGVFLLSCALPEPREVPQNGDTLRFDSGDIRADFA